VNKGLLVIGLEVYGEVRHVASLPVSKTDVPKGLASSTLALSAKNSKELIYGLVLS